MRHRQTIPERWLIIASPQGLAAVKRLPRGSGVLLLRPLATRDLRELRVVARARALTVVLEGAGTAARVHNSAELRRALLARTPLVLLSPLFPTASHPDWKPLSRMKAAALARLAGRSLIALGGMDERRYRTVRRLGFIGWAGIGAWTRDRPRRRAP